MPTIFHTEQEIYSQPEIWRKTVESFKEMDIKGLPDFRNYDQTIFIGCGSTYYLSIWAGRLLRENHVVDVLELPSSEVMLTPQIWAPKSKRTLLVSVSRSGETSETIQAVRAFREQSHGDVLAITCYPDSELSKLADWVIGIPGAQETSIAQTRSFTNMMLGVALFISGSVPDDTGALLFDTGKNVLEKYKKTAEEIGRNGDLNSFFFLGSGKRYGLACEAMLKLKEMSLTYSEAYHFLEFRHGPMAMVDENCLIVGLLGDESSDLEFDVLKDMKEFGARILVLAPEKDKFMADEFDEFVSLGTQVTSIWLQPLYLPILQTIALERSFGKGLNPDQPTHLEAVVRL